MKKHQNTRLISRLAALVCAVCLICVFCSCEGKPKFSLGRWEGDVYKNDMLSLYFKIPDKWHMADKVEAQELLGLPRTVFTAETEETIAEAEKKKNFDLGYAFVLVSSSGKDRFDLLYQKNTDSSTTETYIKAAKAQLESYSDLWDITTVSEGVIKICGHEYYSTEMQLENDESVLRYFYCTTLVDDYFVTIVLTTSLKGYSFDSFLDSLEYNMTVPLE